MPTSLKYRSQLFGEYLMNQYYFKVFTGQDKPLPINQQLLQHQHMETILHEYIHYIHEISTQIGTLSLLYAVTYRSILSYYVEKRPDSSGFQDNISLQHVKTLEGIQETIGAMMGDDFSEVDGPITAIKGYELFKYDIEIPHGTGLVNKQIEIPVLIIDDNGKEKNLEFSKFFLYEGLAYELEKIFQINARGKCTDDADGTEYTVLRYFAELLAPGASLPAILTIASFALSYVNCGAMFVSYMKYLTTAGDRGETESQCLARLKERVQGEYKERNGLLEGVLEEIDDAYRGRSSLYAAFQSIKQQYIDSYKARIQNPSFEVDMVINHDIDGLLTIVPPCDYWYVFTDADEYMRDYAGTSKVHQAAGLDVAEAHHVLIAQVHYSNVLFYNAIGKLNTIGPGDEAVRCPFYTACNLKFRKENPGICNSKPWETYGLSYHSDKRYCTYGSGVLQTKGINTPTP